MTKHTIAVTGLVMAAVAVAGGIVSGFAYYNSRAEQTCTISTKDRVTGLDGESNMRVYTTDCGTFTVKDNALFLLYNSADLYGSLQEGETYQLDTAGWRVPVFSMFPDILAAERVSS